ncbi:STAS domain-containing protein [Actinokineospora guangxiensis]|uniref:STAS domain-containing protein n=1 Tax=Actinokineospora guangxiensis TaxID=1490288 RepID=A0ABW0ERJ9_9PSEU
MTSNETAIGGLAAVLRERKSDLLGQWVARAAETLRGRLTTAELEQEFRELFDSILQAMDAGATDVRSDAFAEVRGNLEQMSQARARVGFTPSETAVAVFGLKRALFEVLDQDDTTIVRKVVMFSQLLDDLGLWTFEAYAKTREQVISQQSEQLLELTTPVVKLWEGVLAVPLVGTLDSERTQVVTESLLQTLVDTGAEHAIIDITGVLAVDTQVAQHLLKTVMAARLMGAQVIISGIRPQIAQTIVALGIDFGDITTKASLADALLMALRSSGVDVVRRPASRGR